MSLVALAVVGLALLMVAERSKTLVTQQYLSAKREAASLARTGLDAIREARLELGWPIDVDTDPYETGLIGDKVSLITTDVAFRKKKVLALDPNLAAMFVELLKLDGVGEGDLVAVAVTGAFPMLNVAVLSAIETVGATPVTITSVGSSNWGANNPDLTWLDMESVLIDAGLLRHRSVAASRGGGRDRGRLLSAEGRALIDSAAVRNGVPLIDEPALDDSIARRMAIYEEAAGGADYAAYVNVGGGRASTGSGTAYKELRPGVSRNLGTDNLQRRGTLFRMAQRGMPVLHVPSADYFIKEGDLATDCLTKDGDLVTTPTPLPEVGIGGIFFRDTYNVPLAGILTVLYGFLIFVVVRIDLKHYLFRKPQ
jgi:poly-gamma-glutamate system protein